MYVSQIAIRIISVIFNKIIKISVNEHIIKHYKNAKGKIVFHSSLQCNIYAEY